jgi:hypothetical protein
MYRQQFLDYLDRYDSPRARDYTPASSGPLKRSLGSEWFRKPSAPIPHTPQSTNISFSSQSSAIVELDDDTGPTREEGESYLSTPRVIPGPNFDVLQWWKENEGIHPLLSQVAKDILAVQIAQVGVERVFNTSKDVIGDRRHSLSAQTIRQTMILRHWISGGQPIATPIDDEPPPIDEVDDLFELPAPVDVLDWNNNVENENSTDDEPMTPSRRQPPRKKTRPERYRM